MSTQQPEALRLANDNEICALAWPKNSIAHKIHQDTAAELRRLHELNQEVLGALKDLADLYDTDEGCRALPEYINARAAIAKAGGAA